MILAVCNESEAMMWGVFLGVLLVIAVLMLVWLGYCIGKDE